jgi:hypothetical protein
LVNSQQHIWNEQLNHYNALFSKLDFLWRGKNYHEIYLHFKYIYCFLKVISFQGTINFILLCG